ncbi:hypothetical protein COT48_05170 [Candidatus Woesearchaeota archaeon CG08_land_8_20_14_0_20_47_9]|nr:MAG: hypothetical protein COT48_05170 [Candidatus Woesearchaeota archaeon CG08_land_8_20_14_0_20_47_9]
MSIKPEDCLVIEDSAIGVNSAFNAKMKCIAVPNRFTRFQDFDKAVHVLNNLTRDAMILNRKL